MEKQKQRSGETVASAAHGHGPSKGTFKILEDLGDEEGRNLAAIYFKCVTGYSEEPLRLDDILEVRFEQIDASSPGRIGAEPTMSLPVLMRNGTRVVLLGVLDGEETDKVIQLFGEAEVNGRLVFSESTHAALQHFVDQDPELRACQVRCITCPVDSFQHFHALESDAGRAIRFRCPVCSNSKVIYTV